MTPGRAGRAGGRRPVAVKRAWVAVAGGLLWAVVVMGAVGYAATAAAIVLVPVAVVAATSGARMLDTGSRRRVSALAVAGGVGAVAVPGAALAGPLPAVAGLAALAVVVLIVAGPGRPGRPGLAMSRLVVAVGPALAASSVVLARHQGSSRSLALLGATLAFDAGAFMMGDNRGASGGAAGVVSGLVSVGVVAVFVAAIMDPPFSGVRPWAVFAVVGLMAAAGVWLCERAVAGARSPALRRLDSLTLAAPAWMISLAVIGYH